MFKIGDRVAVIHLHREGEDRRREAIRVDTIENVTAKQIVCGPGQAPRKFNARNSNAYAHAGNVAAHHWNPSPRFSLTHCSVGTADGLLAIDMKVVPADTRRSARNRDTDKLLPPDIRDVP